MQESFIQHLWSLQYFDKAGLSTTEAEPIEVYEPGSLNTDAGPDFSNARLRIGSMQWVGSVEIHLQSSEWYDHHHDEDGAYDKVILHVVWTDNKPVVRRDGSRLPTLELRGRVREGMIRSYRQLIGSSFAIPCQQTFPSVNGILKQDMVTKALLCRLERKADEVLALFRSVGNDWEETTYQLMASAFGFKINREPFFQLARALPSRILQKHNDIMSTEALLFGTAGFLEDKRGDNYYLALQKEYRLLAHKYGLEKERLAKTQWLFLRLRPPNFPTVRIAQLGALLHHSRNFFSKLLESETLEQLIDLFIVPTSDYWLTHYQFSKPSALHTSTLGKASLEIIVVNTVVPLLATYARWADESTYTDRAIRWLEQLPAEENAIIRRWHDLGFAPGNSLEAQGQIELFNTFCQRKRCLQCTIGAAIVRPSDEHPSDSS